MNLHAEVESVIDRVAAKSEQHSGGAEAFLRDQASGEG